jgi:hypothetical protein
VGVVDDLLRARDAYDRRDWLAAYGGLSEAGAGALTAKEPAAGDVPAAVRSAFWCRRPPSLKLSSQTLQDQAVAALTPAATRSDLEQLFEYQTRSPSPTDVGRVC